MICIAEGNEHFSVDHVVIADNYFSRLRGLMFRKEMGMEAGLLLKNCGSIHCCFMFFPIDVIYLNNRMEVLKVETVRPWRVGSLVKGAKHVLEVAQGAASSLQQGDVIKFKEVDA